MNAPVREGADFLPSFTTLTSRMDADMPEAQPVVSLDACVEHILEHCGEHIRLAAPLGLGKPNALINALYQRVADDSSRQMDIYTALSLAPPDAGDGLQARFLRPFLARHFGEDYPALDYVADQLGNRLPGNIRVHEFYLLSGALLASTSAQRNYASENYTHVARDLVPRRINVVVQLVAARGDGDTRQYSLSCNPDVTLDLLDRIKAAGQPRPLMVGVVHPELPFLGNNAQVSAQFLDRVHDIDAPAHKLFALPREPIDDSEYAIGYHASTLVRDGGTLQIGIGALSDALVSALLVRQQDNRAYRDVVAALAGDDVEDRAGRQLDAFDTGLYGASEMVMDGFMHLRKAGILKRQSYDDMAIEQASAEGLFAAPLAVGCVDALLDRGVLPEHVDARQLARLQRFGLLPEDARLDEAGVHLADGRQLGLDLRDEAARAAWDDVLEGRRLRDGRYLRGAFFLGSSALYQWLGQLEGDDYDGLDMTRVSDVNQLYGGRERLDALQRRGARFFNTCMMATVMGAAVSDQLEDGRVVSGVGGQYNFVAMAHELDDGRSILLLHATHESHGSLHSNIRYNYGHTTIPRHLRDIYITEYGVADLRGLSDQDCIKAMLSIADARFIDELAAEARRNGKLDKTFRIPDAWRANTPQALSARLVQARRAGTLPAFPLGSDFDASEQALLPALDWLGKRSASRLGRARLLIHALITGHVRPQDKPALQRMGLLQAAGVGARLERRVLLAALRKVQ